MSYKEFKAALDKKVLTEEDKINIEMLLMIQLTFDAIIIDHVQSLCDTIKASSSGKSMVKYGTIQQFAKDGKCRSMNNRLQKLVRQYSENLSNICHFNEQAVADAMDAAYDMLHTPMMAYYRYLKNECRSGGAKDIVMLTKILFIICALDLAANIYDNITSERNYKVIAEVPKYKFLRMDSIYEQIVKMLTYMDFKDKNGDNLKLDLKAIKMSEQSLSICDDIISIVYSVEYVNNLFIARTGQNPNIGNGDFKSMLPSLENKTLTIDEYNRKYQNLFI